MLVEGFMWAAAGEDPNGTSLWGPLLAHVPAAGSIEGGRVAVYDLPMGLKVDVSVKVWKRCACILFRVNRFCVRAHADLQ